MKNKAVKYIDWNEDWDKDKKKIPKGFKKYRKIEIEFDWTMTESLVWEGLRNEVRHIVAMAKKQADIKRDGKIEVNVLIAMSYKDLQLYTDAKNDQYVSKV